MDVSQQWPKGLLGKVEVAEYDGGHLSLGFRGLGFRGLGV